MSSPNIPSKEVQDYGPDLLLLCDYFTQGSRGFGGQELRFSEKSSPVRWLMIFGGR